MRYRPDFKTANGVRMTPPTPRRLWPGLYWQIAALFALLLLSWPPAHASEARTGDAGQVVHLLDYIAVDYAGAVRDGKIEDAGEFAEMQEFGHKVAQLIDTLPGADPALRRPLAVGARQLAVQIESRADSQDIARLASELKRQAISAWQLRVAPRRTPDLARGATLYAEHCAACHGSSGHGDGPAAKGLEPAPSNFFDRERMTQRSLHGLYNTITLGVGGTAMAAWPQLDDEQRWALAFYVGGLASTAEQLAAGEAAWQAGGKTSAIRDLAALTGRSAREVGAEAPLLAWLTRHPEALASLQGDPLQLSRRLLGQSVDALRAGRSDEAQGLAVASYLEGFELAENGLDQVDHTLRVDIENEMMAFRKLLATGDLAAVTARAEVIDQLLVRAADKLGSTRLSPTAAGLSAFGILFREGLEAILVLAAIAAGVVRTSGSGGAMRYVHAGWIGALLAGAATWLVAEKLVAISGATRELTEGITALISASILLYVGFWLHGKAHAEDWQRFLGQRLDGALTRGTLSLLAAVSFLAVYREAFETVLFYQALAAQAGGTGDATQALGLGAGSAALLLVGLAWGVFRGGLKLPVGLFFRVSAALLALLAVVFAGQGIAALQEAGRIAADPVSFIRLPLLGVYPTVQTLTAQVVALSLIASTLLWQRRQLKAR